MPPQSKSAPKASGAPRWTSAQLLAVKHLGPAIIGDDMHAAAQALVTKTHGGAFGPALLGEPGYSQAGPTKIVDGKPVFAERI